MSVAAPVLVSGRLRRLAASIDRHTEHLPSKVPRYVMVFADGDEEQGEEEQDSKAVR